MCVRAFPAKRPEIALAQGKAVAQRVVRVEAEATLAGDVRDAADLDDHCLARTDRRRVAQHLTGEDRAGAALERTLFAHPCLPPRDLQRHTCGDSTAGRAAIDLAAREDANVAARC